MIGYSEHLKIQTLERFQKLLLRFLQPDGALASCCVGMSSAFEIGAGESINIYITPRTERNLYPVGLLAEVSTYHHSFNLESIIHQAFAVTGLQIKFFNLALTYQHVSHLSALYQF